MPLEPASPTPFPHVMSPHVGAAAPDRPGPQNPGEAPGSELLLPPRQLPLPVHSAPSFPARTRAHARVTHPSDGSFWNREVEAGS